MTKALADRLAEAFAEALHVILRTEVWSYCSAVKLASSKLHSIKCKLGRCLFSLNTGTIIKFHFFFRVLFMVSVQLPDIQANQTTRRNWPYGGYCKQSRGLEFDLNRYISHGARCFCIRSLFCTSGVPLLWRWENHNRPSILSIALVTWLNKFQLSYRWKTTQRGRKPHWRRQWSSTIKSSAL